MGTARHLGGSPTSEFFLKIMAMSKLTVETMRTSTLHSETLQYM